MSLILGIETSTKICSVALSDGDQLLALKEEGGDYSHSEKLTLFIEEVMQQAGKTLKDVSVIAVSKGPGSYTGLRIGVSAAKGLCYALDIPLIAVSTLQAMARGMVQQLNREPNNHLFCPMIDARRMEVYTALFDSENNTIENISAKIIDENSLSTYLNDNSIIFFGDGAEKCQSTLSKNKNAIFSNQGLPSAQYINQIAFQKFLNKDFEDLAYFEPYYLKDFIATTPKKLL
ncbi:MAG: tRNA (adenosine(37)-N6)-threonylcarbamoyltransferase complex dimerization subunit type 1 TsaB [Vicingus serpentipes]|nr:tRNA (adenosine(37)-N6)-threonylcarbamoyltransferase complex dimerization subunit type 1 TsaB [Vicingus serpentipes]